MARGLAEPEPIMQAGKRFRCPPVAARRRLRRLRRRVLHAARGQALGDGDTEDGSADHDQHGDREDALRRADGKPGDPLQHDMFFRLAR